MNKIKFALVSLALVLGFTSCNKNDYEYTPGNPTAGESNLYFDDEENLTMDLTDDEIEITLNRASAEGALTVPLKVVTAPDFVTVPSTATFADGETQTIVKLAIGEGMVPYTVYNIIISIPEEYTQPYSDQAGSPVYNFKISKEDFAVVAKGVFYSSVALTGSWEQELQYSEYLNLYRLPNLFGPFGVEQHVYFHYGLKDVTVENEGGENVTEQEEDFYFTDANGNHLTKFGTGYVHPSYGELIANINEDEPMGYEEYIDEETGQTIMDFYWMWKITVSAGSFGEKYQYYVLNEWVKKPWEKDAE